jgi:hypothetical protein
MNKKPKKKMCTHCWVKGKSLFPCWYNEGARSKGLLADELVDECDVEIHTTPTKNLSTATIMEKEGWTWRKLTKKEYILFNAFRKES